MARPTFFALRSAACSSCSGNCCGTESAAWPSLEKKVASTKIANLGDMSRSPLCDWLNGFQLLKLPKRHGLQLRHRKQTPVSGGRQSCGLDGDTCNSAMLSEPAQSWTEVGQPEKLSMRRSPSCASSL